MAIALPTFILAFGAILTAWFRGGQPERGGAVVLLGMLILNYAGHAFFPRVFDALDPVALTVDVLGFLGFSVIGITSKRIWPLWAASLQLLSTGAHFVRVLSIPVEARTYFWMKTAPTWIVMVVLIIGTVAYRRRLRSHSNAPSSSG